MLGKVLLARSGMGSTPSKDRKHPLANALQNA